jgi:hypothetical protein
VRAPRHGLNPPLTPDQRARVERLLAAGRGSHVGRGQNARRIMGEHDRLPPEWRALVHEYGLQGVRDARRKRYTARDAAPALAAALARLQPGAR